MLQYLSHFFKTKNAKGYAMETLSFAPLTDAQIKIINKLSDGEVNKDKLTLEDVNVLKGISSAQLKSLTAKVSPYVIDFVKSYIAEPLTEKQIAVVQALNDGSLRMYEIPAVVQHLLKTSSLEEISKIEGLRPKILQFLAEMHSAKVLTEEPVVVPQPQPIAYTEFVEDAGSTPPPPTPQVNNTAPPTTAIPLPPSIPSTGQLQLPPKSYFVVDNIEDTLRDLNYWTSYLYKKDNYYKKYNFELAKRTTEQLQALQLCKSKLQKMLVKGKSGGSKLNSGVGHTQVMAAVENAHNVMGAIRQEYLGHLDLAQSNLKSANSQITSLKSEIEASKAQISKIQSDFATRDAERMANLNSLQAAMEASKADYSKNISQKNDEIAACNAEVQKLSFAQKVDADNSNAKISELSNKISELQELEAACNTAKSALEESLASAQNDLENALTSGTASQAQVDALNAEIDSLNSKIAQLEEPVFFKTSAMTASGTSGLESENIELTPSSVNLALGKRNERIAELAKMLDTTITKNTKAAADLAEAKKREEATKKEAEGKMSKGTVALIVLGSVIVVGGGAYYYAGKR